MSAHPVSVRAKVRRKPQRASYDTEAVVPIEEASVKARGGTTSDPESDFDEPVWAGHIPARLIFDAPVPADHLPASVDPAGRDVMLNPAFGDVTPVASGRPG